MSATERSGWRDEELSRLHRRWGFNCPAVDVDFLMIEYDKGLPRGLVEYKHEDAPLLDLTHSSYRAIARLATDGQIPAFVVRYATDFSWWRVTALNDHGRKYYPETTTVSEREWVTTLYWIRGRPVPDLSFLGEVA